MSEWTKGMLARSDNGALVLLNHDMGFKKVAGAWDTLPQSGCKILKAGCTWEEIKEEYDVYHPVTRGSFRETDLPHPGECRVICYREKDESWRIRIGIHEPQYVQAFEGKSSGLSIFTTTNRNYAAEYTEDRAEMIQRTLRNELGAGNKPILAERTPR